jgi:outer membrane biosynthesis protein TonB
MKEDGEEEDSEGSAILSDDEEEEEEEPVPSAKRKRKEQPEPVERNLKSKKVAFAREPSKTTKSSQPKQKAAQPTKKAPKVANAKKGNAIVPTTGGNEAYDFSKFF